MSLFLEAARGQDTARAPIWIMRQAGRYLSEYRALRARYSFWEMCRTPELAAEVTLQPLRRFDLDAAILFQDIMTPLPPMGVEIDFSPGPVLKEPVRSAQQVRALRVPEGGEIAPFVAEAIRLIRAESPVPLIGFGGAPLTLATYLVQGSGSKDYDEFRQFLRYAPETAHALLDKLTDLSVRYLKVQLQAGAQAVQLFDSWAGLHDARVYREFAKPYNTRIFEALAAFGVPRLYIAVGALHLYGEIKDLPCEVVSVDWRVPLSHVRPLLPGKTLQGNLDPAVLLAPEGVLRAEAERVLREGLGGPHIFNLGHGIMRQTDPERLAQLVAVVREFDRRAHTTPEELSHA
ncbi:uroporphyrinogen decarboxylase [Truepera radiovictrix]|uniref:Uroporphyrinogen decarboxylase n=1 Tax=Truepera radiovictrix (strain DSM 17093 / CIP 108686 / LMG 22925 / RQ-24) TaxID=649638 RepID=D7CY02_TRURR|nr:uroporphyrinogen decarboxylase [Truepera radiovictrix]ADI13362.1 uroporphyrinogen decarboxylase [Truepera radiovictrix DSM 17093]WMT58075.1 uroporphyrinogen decarboxylase [Truepera radiovictrix]